MFGRPNVGKSSLLNRFINEDKAIVTNIPGTTRDIVDATFKINDIIINLYDTAGIRETNNVIEQIGVKKSLEILDKVNLIIVVLNNNEELSDYDKDILEKTKNNPRIIFVNKNDLEKKIDLKIYENKENIVYGNTIDDSGIDKLKNKILELFNLENIKEEDLTYLSNARIINLLDRCNNLILNIEKSILEDLPIDMIEIDLKEIWNTLGEIIGDNYSEELIDTMFKNFCLGK